MITQATTIHHSFAFLDKAVDNEDVPISSYLCKNRYFREHFSSKSAFRGTKNYWLRYEWC